MRLALGWFLSAVVLVGSYAVGVFGEWALGATAVALLLAAVVAAVAMEDRDNLALEGLAAPSPALREPRALASSEDLSLNEDRAVNDAA